MRVFIAAAVALVIGFLVGLLLSDVINPGLQTDKPFEAPRATQKN